jgi:Xaa-Pro aminopeptidase
MSTQVTTAGAGERMGSGEPLDTIPGGMSEELAGRLSRVQGRMSEKGFDAIIVYGDYKLCGSLRYLSGYFPDRTGWISTGPNRSDVRIFGGGAVFIPRDGEAILLVEPGSMLDQESCLSRVLPAAQGLQGGDEGLSVSTLTELIDGVSADAVVGIETWDRFPAPLYLGMEEALPKARFVVSVIVEELRLVKSDWEMGLVRRAGEVADLGHRAMCEALSAGPTDEVEAIRSADSAMREADPIFEETVPSSPSKICSGSDVCGLLLHIPLKGKTIRRGDIVNWDICMRYQGYTIDTSRTRMLGRPSAEHERAYEAVLRAHEEVLGAAVPGAAAVELVRVAEESLSAEGYELWERFVGHGTGLDCHERPDMGHEELPLEANMILCLEPRVVVEGRYLLANEDMVRVTPSGGESLTRFPKTPLQL